MQRLRNEKKTPIADREEKRELVRYVEQEKSLTKRRAQADILTRARCLLTGMPSDDEVEP